MGAAGQLGRQARRRYPDRAASHAADGTFFPHSLPQILKVWSVRCGTSARSGRFLGMWRKHAVVAICALTGVAGGGGARAPPPPAPPPAQTAAPAPAADCSPMRPVPPRGTV